MKFSRCKCSPVTIIVTPPAGYIKDANSKGFEQDIPCLPYSIGVLFI